MTEQILRDFFSEVAQARELVEVNIAAGRAMQRLELQELEARGVENERTAILRESA